MIYCVEDERNIRELIVYTLESTGLPAKGLENSSDLFKEIDKKMPSLILLDVMLPGEDGIQILKKIKISANTKHIPVIMVTAKGAEYDKVIGLDEGADDYITKPFGMMEFVSRVKAVLRRVKVDDPKKELSVGDIKINLEQHNVFVKDENILLTLKEYELLKFLIENIGIVLTRDRLLEHIWGYDFDGETRTVDVHIRTLRQKLLEAGNIIETVRGVGYRIQG
jgi:two-component system, OmpR family, alkaline phosphatase synthesis response regulator PhoP